jgi:hypothetical protein
MAKAVKNKGVKGGNGATKIEVKDLEVGVTYKNYVQDLCKVLSINETTQTVCLYNITGAFRQWILFNNVNLVQKIR